MLFNLKFIGLQPQDSAPNLALYSVDASGQIDKKLATAKDGKLHIDPELAKQGRGVVAFGPDVADLTQLSADSVIQLRLQDRLPEWRSAEMIAIPQDWWQRWHIFDVCVSGSMHRCFPFLFEAAASVGTRLALKRDFEFPIPEFCLPICNGVVEIYERTCCCLPPIFVDIPVIVQKIRQVVGPIGPGPDPAPDRVALRSIKAADAFGTANLSAAPDPRLQQDVQALESLQPAEALRYFIDRPYLFPFWCHCSSARIGETVINPDGTFTFCFFKFPFLRPFCRTTYYYKVRQWQDTQWVTIYDGAAAHQYFGAGDFADLKTFLGRTCGQMPQLPGGPKPFVMLQDIGATHSFSLVSHYMGKNGVGTDLTQVGQFSVANPVANGGLVNAPYNAPWGEDLYFRLFFHPGMEALGAFYYRASIVAADANGQPAGGATPQPITNAISWLKFVFTNGQFEVESESLGPNTKVVGADTVTGLMKIPYDADALWLGGQFHQYVDTRGFSNGRFLIMVEVFDQNGVRLRPTGAADPGTDKDFQFLRWLEETGPNSTSVVPFAALTHLFWFDNRATYGDIEDLKRNHVANSQECQFLTGPASTLFSVGFRAFHAATADPIPAPATFMDSFELWYHRGLNGPTVVIQTGNTNQPPGLLVGPNADSTALTFGSMLCDNAMAMTCPVGTKCTFAVNLYVWAKHTNGSRRLSEYDRSDQAAFALEIT